MPSPNKHSAHWQRALLTQLNVLNYTHSLPEHMSELQRLPGALNPFLTQAFCWLCSNRPAQQQWVLQRAPLATTQQQGPSASPAPALGNDAATSIVQGDLLHCPRGVGHGGEKNGVRKHDKNFDQSIFLHIQPTV